MTDYNAFLTAGETWVAETLDVFPEREPHHPISWSIDGLSALYLRLEHLKAVEVEIGSFYDEAVKLHAHGRRLLASLRAQEEDAIGNGLEARASDMVQRGMAAEERMIAHRTRAIDIGIWRRRYESLVDSLDSVVRLSSARHFAILAEREDVRAQIRGISLGREIGEL